MAELYLGTEVTSTGTGSSISDFEYSSDEVGLSRIPPEGTPAERERSLRFAEQTLIDKCKATELQHAHQKKCIEESWVALEDRRQLLDLQEQKTEHERKELEKEKLEWNQSECERQDLMKQKEAELEKVTLAVQEQKSLLEYIKQSIAAPHNPEILPAHQVRSYVAPRSVEADPETLKETACKTTHYAEGPLVVETTEVSQRETTQAKTRDPEHEAQAKASDVSTLKEVKAHPDEPKVNSLDDINEANGEHAEKPVNIIKPIVADPPKETEKGKSCF